MLCITSKWSWTQRKHKRGSNIVNQEKTYLESITMESFLQHFDDIPTVSAGGLCAAERVELVSGYCLDGYQVDKLVLYFMQNWKEHKNANSAPYTLIDIVFRFGYLKGARAAMAGKFKEPPRRRNTRKS